jgi:glycosyltransferase involved in cell wall biosynthesis
MRLLHRVIWRWGVQRIDQHVTRYWGITEESCDFLADVYRVPREKIDLLPLGAAVDIAGLDDQASVRARVREDIGVAPTDLLLVTGGKIDSRKRIHEVMRAVREMKRDDVKLLVFGSVLPDIQDAFDSSLDDARIKYVGWADAESMAEYLIASDLGVFPGGQSVLWMQAVVSGIPCIFRRWPKGSPVDIGGNCRFLETDEYSELARVLAEITEVPDVYSRMKQAALGSQRWQYSYAKIAERAISEQ